MRKRSGFKIVKDIISKYKNNLTESSKRELIDAMKRELIIRRKGFIFLIDSGKGSMTSFADMGSYEYGSSDLKGRKRE